MHHRAVWAKQQQE